MNLQEIESAITELSTEELAKFSVWFADYQAKVWDEQIKRDLDVGRLDEVLEEVYQEFDDGKAEVL